MTSRSDTSGPNQVRAGDRVLVGRTIIEVDEVFASSVLPGDEILGIAATQSLRRVPKDVAVLVRESVGQAVAAFSEMQKISDEQITRFFSVAAMRLADDAIFVPIKNANDEDVHSAQSRGRSTTRLVLSSSMRSDMVSALQMWQYLAVSQQQLMDTTTHDGWRVEQWRAPLGVLGFVFEGRPNVFADATGVLRTGNTVVFRIGSDALGTARALMQHVITPALLDAGIPKGAVSLVDSPEHAAGWALFSDSRLGLAVARGSGEAVAELGAIAQQVGTPVSLHGTGGAWILAGLHCDLSALHDAVMYSLDRKVCNTVNAVCIPRAVAPQLVPLVFDAAQHAAQKRNTQARVHCVGGAQDWLVQGKRIDVVRAQGVVQEEQISVAQVGDLAHEWEWESTPEFFIAVVDDLDQAIEWCNTYSPQFVVSVISDDLSEHELVWSRVNAPFVGNGFTRWVDGQFALSRPELGLSNWQNGRLFGRGGVLSGDSAFTVRLKVIQDQPDIHR